MALWNKLVNQTNRRAQGSIYEQQAANLWLMKHHQQSLETANCRFDVVAFEGNQPPLWIPNFLG